MTDSDHPTMIDGHVYAWCTYRAGEYTYTVHRPEWDVADVGPATDLTLGMAVDCLADNAPLRLAAIRDVLVAARVLADHHAVIQLASSPMED